MRLGRCPGTYYDQQLTRRSVNHLAEMILSSFRLFKRKYGNGFKRKLNCITKQQKQQNPLESQCNFPSLLERIRHNFANLLVNQFKSEEDNNQ